MLGGLKTSRIPIRSRNHRASLPPHHGPGGMGPVGEPGAALSGARIQMPVDRGGLPRQSGERFEHLSSVR